MNLNKFVSIKTTYLMVKLFYLSYYFIKNIQTSTKLIQNACKTNYFKNKNKFSNNFIKKTK